MEADSCPCQYSRAGCRTVPLASDKLDHEEMCDYRMCQCPYPVAKCEWQGRIMQVAHHLVTFHGLTVVKGEEIVLCAADISAAGDYHWIILQFCFDNYFMLVIEKRQLDMDEIRYFGVAKLLGSKNKAETFNYRMELNKRGVVLTWDGKPRSLFDSANVPDRATDCFVLEHDIALMFPINQALQMSVTITESE